MGFIKLGSGDWPAWALLKTGWLGSGVGKDARESATGSEGGSCVKCSEQTTKLVDYQVISLEGDWWKEPLVRYEKQLLDTVS